MSTTQDLDFLEKGISYLRNRSDSEPRFALSTGKDYRHLFDVKNYIFIKHVNSIL
jgi:hypothetical protein